MSEADRRLKDIFAADAPPARDPAFIFAMLQTHERRRLREEVALHAGGALAGGALLWAALPWIGPGVEAFLPVAAPLAAAAATVISVMLLTRMVGPSPSRD
jgi:hypothetical protein